MGKCFSCSAISLNLVDIDFYNLCTFRKRAKLIARSLLKLARQVHEGHKKKSLETKCWPIARKNQTAKTNRVGSLKYLKSCCQSQSGGRGTHFSARLGLATALTIPLITAWIMCRCITAFVLARDWDRDRDWDWCWDWDWDCRTDTNAGHWHSPWLWLCFAFN